MNTFEPLQAHDAPLVTQLERVVARGGLTIPPDRMVWMKASAKTTQLNAYVTGIAASKRVVVWDTSIARATPDQISLIFGHEMGHYVLNHIPRGIVFFSALSFVTLWLGFLTVHWLIRRFGTAWGIPSPANWAALAIFLLVLNVFSFLLEPVTNAFSRSMEHQADIYGMEAVHGIVADPQAVAVSSFQLLGQASLVDPTPNAFVEFWTGSHPSISSRAAFAATYNPWQPGQHPQFFRK